MKYTCPSCNLKEEGSNMTVITHGPDTEIRCPRCFVLLVTFTDNEEEPIDLEGCEIDQYLPSSDQCRYSLHLYEKQLSKVRNAMKQLEEMITKTQVLMELALEKEAR